MTSCVARLSSLLFCQEANTDAITNEREQVEEMIDLKAALARLEPWQRLVLGYWAQGYTQQEIAERLQVSHNRVCEWLQEMKIG